MTLGLEQGSEPLDSDHGCKAVSPARGNRAQDGNGVQVACVVGDEDDRWLESVEVLYAFRVIADESPGEREQEPLLEGEAKGADRPASPPVRTGKGSLDVPFL